MNNIMSVIFASDNESKLNELTLHRTTASLPIAGRYRCVDFTLSNLVNNQITSIGIITRSNYSSLMDHIRMGRDWDLNRKNGGIIVFPPYASNSTRNIFRGKVEALYGIMEFFVKAPEEYVVVTNSNIIANIDFDDVYKFHMDNNSDITLLSYTAKPTSSKRVILECEESGRVKGIKITKNESQEDAEISINCYFIKKSLLMQLVADNFERGYIDFEKNILQQNVENLQIYSYHLSQHVALIDDVKSYYNESMEMLKYNVRKELFNGEGGQIYTKVKDSVPTRYGANAHVENSLIADGCYIDGKVVNSILFRGVTVEKDVEIIDSIVMENGHIMKNSSLNCTITDKEVTVTEDKHISGYNSYPVVIVKNKTV